MSGGVEPEDARTAGAAASAIDADALRWARRGDQAAFTALITPLLQPSYHLAVRLLGDRQLAEDITQEAMVKAWLGVRRFRGDARFSTWVFRIVHNACTDALRQRARRPQAPTSWGEDEASLDVPDPGPSLEDQVADRDVRARIMAAVDGLPPPWRAVIVLRDVQGLSYEEIAVITGEHLGTVKSRLHRARAAVRQALEGLESEVGTFPQDPRPTG